MTGPSTPPIEPAAGPTPPARPPLAPLAWALAGLVLAAFYLEWSREWPLPGAPALGLAWAAWGAYLAYRLGFRAESGRPDVGPARSAAALILLTLTASGLFGGRIVEYADDVRFQWRFANRVRLYDAAVADLKFRKGLRPGPDAAQGLPCVVDVGPPLRIAFREKGGLLDEWQAVVYDPTGLVLRAVEPLDPATAAKDDLRILARALFGGRIVRVRRLSPNYYRCWFT